MMCGDWGVRKGSLKGTAQITSQVEKTRQHEKQDKIRG